MANQSSLALMGFAGAKEFEETVRAAADHHGMLPELVRKDYWVTRVLRAIATDSNHDGTVVFKGGTSLSKGWKLIDRFSEDIDLLLSGPAFGPVPSKPDREKQFKKLRRQIEAETPLQLPGRVEVSPALWNHHYFRSDYKCNIRYALPGNIVTLGGPTHAWLLVESGFRGGVQPHARRHLSSLVAEFLDTQPEARAKLSSYAADFDAFEMDLLKPERTFAEKLLLLHEAMSKGDEGARDVSTRHFYDVAQLFSESGDVQASINSGDVHELFREAAEISNRYFDAQLDVDHLVLRDSPALDPSPAQLKILRARYENPLEQAVYYRGAPSFEEVMSRVREIRATL